MNRYKTEVSILVYNMIYVLYNTIQSNIILYYIVYSLMAIYKIWLYFIIFYVWWIHVFHIIKTVK